MVYGLLFSGLLLGSFQEPVVLVTTAPDLASSVAQLDRIRDAGMHVRVVTGPGVFFGTLEENASTDMLMRMGAIIRAEETSDRHGSSIAQDLALDYLAALEEGRFEPATTRGPMDWDGHPDHQLSRSEAEHESGDREAQTAPDWTCSNSYNSEYMAGTVYVGAFFVESNGVVDTDQYTWTPQAVSDVELQLLDAWSIWSWTAQQHGVTVTAVLELYGPGTSTTLQPYEPVLHPSTEDHLWIGAIMGNLGFSGSGHLAACDAFNSSKRLVLNATHSYCSFIAYNPPAQGASSAFTDGRIGYAYLGGPYLQLLYKANGWGTDQVNRVFGHETAHIFHAFDEYAGSGTSNCARAFNGTQNANFQGAQCNGMAPCVMVGNTWTGSGATRQWDLCAHTPAHLGWNSLLVPPTPKKPLNDTVLTTQPVMFKWQRNGAPPSAYGYLKVFDRSSGDLVQCVYSGQNDSLPLNLVNGSYEWTISQGNTNDASGWAGVLGAAGQFKVNAPLNASFTRAPAVVCAGSYVDFTNTSTGAPVSWSWDFPGGQPAAYDGPDPPPVLYMIPGYKSVSLTVSDGSTEHTFTQNNAVTVTGGQPLPFVQDMNGGGFPPPGWSATTTGQGLAWSGDAVPGCGAQTSAFVNGWSYHGPAATARLSTPRIDLTQATLPYLKFRYSYAPKSPAATEMLQVYGHDCGQVNTATFFNRAGAALATNGGGFVSGQPWMPTTCEVWHEVALPVDALVGRISQFWFNLFSIGGQNVFVDDVTVFDGVRLPVRVLLQGPWDEEEQLMDDGLRGAGLVPDAEPFTAAGYVFPDAGIGQMAAPGVLVVTGPQAIVDWVVLELRDAADPAQVLFVRPALLRRDGSVVDHDGVLPPRIALPAGNYFVSIRHRNHLGTMTATAVPVANGMQPIDLSDPATAVWGADARRIQGNKALLWCGDADQDHRVRYTGNGNDRDTILLTVGSTTPNNSVPGYLPQDTNLNGHVRYTGNSNDRDAILLNVGAGTPSNQRVEQIP